MKLYGLKNCDTCRKALKALVAAGYEAELVDVREAPVSVDVLAGWYAAFGAALLNTRSTTWRGLSESERAGDPLALLAANPALMKRPVIEQADKRTLGWTAAAQKEWI